MILVSPVTVWTDLAMAVLVGVLVSALVFAWKSAKKIQVTELTEKENAKLYLLEGPLFFGSVKPFQEKFNPATDPEDVIIDFKRSRVCDHSGIEAINLLTEHYLQHGTKLHLRHLSTDYLRLPDKAADLVEVNILEDPKYHVADNKVA